MGVAVAVSVFVLPAGTAVLGAVTIAYPNIRVQVPVSEISIGTIGGTRYLEFSHVTWNAGAGPLEMRPVYDTQTGLARMTQALYASDTHGGWTFATTVPIVKQPAFVPPADYRFPMSQFGLYAVTSTGGVGALVRPSPKVDFCMTADQYVGGVANTPNQTAYPGSNCGSPNGTLGLDVGWGDKYDSTDGGENINIATVADGVYWLRAIADPYHYLRDANVSDNVTDTKVRITGSTVSVLAQTHPVATPPTVTMTAPANGSKASGTVTVAAQATAPNAISSVQFLLDGRPLGQPDTTAPYSISWTVGTTSPGTHWLSAQARDALGFYRTAAPVAVTVPPQPRRIGTMTITTHTAVATGSARTAPFAVSAADVLVALVGSDGVGQRATVSGGGLTWTLARRSNHQGGDAEIWVAKAPSALSGVTVTSTPTIAGFDEQLTVLDITGATRVGASNIASGSSGAPSVGLTSTASGSAAFAVGNDFDHAVGRTVGSGQLLLSQFVDTRTGDTYWTQARAAASTAVGQLLTLNDTAPTSDQWNLAAVEVVPSAAPAGVAAAALVNPEENPAPAMACFIMDATSSATGTGRVTTPRLHTGQPDETLLALVAGDAPGGTAQRFALSGGGVKWHLVARADRSRGDAEIWDAAAPSVLTDARVTATPAIGGRRTSLTIIAIQGSNGTGASATSAGTSGAPLVTLRTSAPNSLVFSIGSDADQARARVPGRNQQLDSESLDPTSATTSWVQSTNSQSGPRGTQVTLDSAATSHQWNMAAVEILAEPDANLSDAGASGSPPTSQASNDRLGWLPITSALAACAVVIAATLVGRRRRTRTRASRAHEVA